MIEIRVNGKTETIADACTVGEFLAGKGLAPERVVIERNAAIVRRSEFSATALRAGDVLEIVSFVGGG